MVRQILVTFHSTKFNDSRAVSLVQTDGPSAFPTLLKTVTTPRVSSNRLADDVININSVSRGHRYMEHNKPQHNKLQNKYAFRQSNYECL